MDDNQHLVYQVETDGTQAVKSISDVARELANVATNTRQLEAQLKALLGGDITGKARALAGYMKLISQAERLPNNLRSVARASQTLSWGGVETSLKQSAMRGAVNKLRTDEALQILSYEKETNKVLEARYTLFKRMRTDMPMASSDKRVRDAWTATLTGAGATVDRSKIAAETRNFQRRLSEERLAETRQFQAQEEALYEKHAARIAAQVAKIENSETRAAEISRIAQSTTGRLNSRGGPVNFDATRLEGAISNAVANNRSEAVDQSVIRNQALQRRAQMAHDFMDYQGGAAMFGLQARYTLNNAVMGGVFGGFSYATSSVRELEASLKDLQAITGATDTEIGSLKKTILDVGAQSKFSLSEISEGTKVLAQAGYSASQIKTVLKPIMDFATATGTAVPDAVATTTSVLTQFDMSLERTGYVTSVMTQALNKSKLSSQQLSLGLQYAGNQAALSGVSFEETNAALAAMANAGIRSGSTLGTGLRSIMAEFDAPSKKFRENLMKIGLTAEDVNLKTHSLSEVIQTLTKSGFTYSDALSSFELRSAAAFAALQNNVGALQSIKDSFTGTTAASEAASTQLDTFNARWTQLLNAMTKAASVGSGPVLSFLKGLIGALGVLVSGAANAGPVLQVVTTGLAAMVAVGALKWAINFGQGLLTNVNILKEFQLGTVLAAAAEGDFAAASAAATAGVEGLTAAVLASPLAVFAVAAGAVAGTLGLLNYALDAGNREIDKYKTKADDAAAQSQNYADRVTELDATIDRLVSHHAELSKNTALAGQAAEAAVGKFHSWGLELDSVRTNSVDKLIASLVTLKQKMVEVQLQKNREQDSALAGQQKEFTGRADLALKDVQYEARAALRDPRLASNPALRQLLSKAASGNLSFNDRLQLQDALSGTDGTPGLRGYTKLKGSFTRYMTAQGSADDVANQRATLGYANAPLQVRSSKAYTDLLQFTTRAQAELNDSAAAANKLKDPKARDAALKDLEARRSAVATEIDKRISSLGQGFSGNSEVLAASAMSGMSPSDFVRNSVLADPSLSQLLASGGHFGGVSDPKVLESSLRLNKIKLRKAKPGSAEAMRLQAEIRDANYQLLKQQNPNMSPDDLQVLLDNTNDADVLSATGSGRRGDRSGSRTASSRAGALKTQIDTLRSSLGPTPADMLAGNAKLASLLAQWKQAREQQIRSGGSTGADLASQLADLNTEAEKFSHEILDGNVAAAKKLLAHVAAQDADDAKNKAVQDINLRGRPLKSAMDDVSAKLTDSMTKNIDSITAQYIASHPGVDPKTSADLQQQIDDAQSEGLQKLVTANMGVINAYYDKVARDQQLAQQKTQFGFDAERAQVGKLSNYWGTQNLSDVQRSLGDRQLRDIQTREAQNAVSNAQSRVDTNQQRIDALNQSRSQVTDVGVLNSIDAEIQKANQDQQQLNLALDRAKMSLDELTGKSLNFASASDAINAAWSVFAEKAQLAKPVLSDLADGMQGVFEQTQNSLQGFVANTLSGTKSVSKGFADMAKSILSAVNDMIAKIVAKKVLSFLAQFIPGGQSFIAQAQGGPVRKALGGLVAGSAAVHMALGGASPAPFRDSVHTLLMPGEYVLRKSAVDMVGTDRLDAINAMGNRRISEMPTIQQAMPQREPDTANVYVVAPNSRPTLTKKDVVAYITDDMMTNGPTKRLIKAISMGVA